MAVASITDRPSQRPQKRRKPDPARVLQSYAHEVDQRGRRGAYRRTGDLYGISDETVRRIVHAAEGPAAAPALPDELAYVPPPGGFSEPEPAPQRATDDISGHALRRRVPQITLADYGDIMSRSRSHVAVSPHVTDATRHTVELAAVADEAAETPRPSLPLPPLPPLPEQPPDPGPDWLPTPDSPVVTEDPTTIGAPPHIRPEADPAPDRPQGHLLIECQPSTNPAPVSMSPIVYRQIVRVPVERQAGGVVGWLREHDGVRMQLLAVVAFLVLVALSWLG